MSDPIESPTPPADETLERVARAIFRHRYMVDDAQIERIWAKSSPTRASAYGAAKAAIEAMNSARPRGGEAVAIITEYYARVAEEKLSAEVARVRTQVAEEFRPVVEKAIRDWAVMYPIPANGLAHGREEILAECWASVATAMVFEAWVSREHAGKGLPGHAAALPDVVGTPDPEADCHRCGRSLAIPWTAPSPLWNAVMRGGSINGDELFDGIVCPTCFAQLAKERGIAELWRFDAARVNVSLETVTPSGRVWDPETWMWREAAPAAEGGGEADLSNAPETSNTPALPEESR